MQAFRSLGRTVLHSLGGVPGFRRLNRHGCRILMYHRFPANVEWLREQCAHIRRYYQPVSMKAIGESLRGGKPLPPNALAVTIDDGHRDFFLYGYPVLREFGIPATVYPVSEFLDGNLWVWTYQVHYLAEQTKRKSAALEIASETLALSFETAEQRTASGDKIARRLNRVENSERLRVLKVLPQLLEVNLPRQAPPEHEALSWDDVRELARNGFEIGAHTKTHPILANVRDAAQLRDEIAGSKKRIEEELGSPVLHFCYPNGNAPDFNDETVEVIRQSGYHTAVTAILGLNFAGADPLLLRRVGVDSITPRQQFHEAVAGVQSSLYASPVVRRLAGI